MHDNIATKYFFQEVSDFDNTTDKNSTTDIISGFYKPEAQLLCWDLGHPVQPCLEE